ncbi:MAG: cupin domain-containing protein [Bacteroidota bacterium]
MKGLISKNNAPQYEWGGNCLSWVLNDTPGLSVKQELMPAGAREQLHYHKHANQFFYVLSGVATFYIEDKVIQVGTHEGIHIKSSQKHLVVNESTGPIEFLVISQPSTHNDRIQV